MTDAEIEKARECGKKVECYVYKSSDALTWTRSGRHFPPEERQSEFQAENNRLETYKDLTRRANPSGAFRSYAFRVECFEEGEAPESFNDDLREIYKYT